jgi:lysophospholipase L1-like esterase
MVAQSPNAVANSPARNWPATAARKLDLNLTCLGFGGQCHLDSMIARLIRDREVDMLTLKLGINVMGAGSLSPRTFRGAVIGFVQIIREKHPDIPIGVISPIISPPRETNTNAVNFCLTDMREELADAVDRIQRVTGDDKIVYFDGLDLFGESLVNDYLPDNLHPNGDGYEVMGHNAADRILPRLIDAL